ncbi:hypothetical protein Ancab_017241, partial [Ancistrocladus abbreviatus]
EEEMDLKKKKGNAHKTCPSKKQKPGTKQKQKPTKRNPPASRSFTKKERSTYTVYHHLPTKTKANPPEETEPQRPKQTHMLQEQTRKTKKTPHPAPAGGKTRRRVSKKTGAKAKGQAAEPSPEETNCTNTAPGIPQQKPPSRNTPKKAQLRTSQNQNHNKRT